MGELVCDIEHEIFQALIASEINGHFAFADFGLGDRIKVTSQDSVRSGYPTPPKDSLELTIIPRMKALTSVFENLTTRWNFFENAQGII
jgi:hypothetical protein